MKRLFIVLFIMLISTTTVFAQKLTVVVGAVGKDPKPGLSKALEMQIKEAFVKDGRFTAVTREEAVLDAVDNEQAHQRSGAVDDAQIKQIGKQLGARYVCVVEVAPLMNSYTLNAQFVDIVSTNIVSVVSVTSTLRNTTEFHKASEELVRKLLGHQTAPTAETAKRVPIRHVAVIETQTDDVSDVAKEVSRADLNEITSVLRREAVKNLPRDRYNVMTSETVQSMGTATAEDCAGENCIITLGSKIGADYVVRGTLSKVRNRLSLTVEIFETEYGNLVAVTPSPIRTTSLDELFDKSEAACAAMYKSFVGTSSQTPTAPQSAASVTYRLMANASPESGGYVSLNPRETRYTAGEKVAVTAIPSKGYVFTGWTGALESAKSSDTITMTNNLTLTANFKIPPKYLLTTNVYPEKGGTVNRHPHLTQYPADTKVTLTATPAKGYEFKEWTDASGRTVSKDAITVGTMNGDKTLNANFVKAQKTQAQVKAELDTSMARQREKLDPTPKAEPKPDVAATLPSEKKKTPPAVNAIRWSGAALAAGGFIGGIVYNGKVNSEYDDYKDARSFGEAEKTRKDTEDRISTRNALYVLGGVGLAAFTVTLFF